MRWKCVDGRWVAISLGQGDDAGKTIVTSSEGQRQAVDDYESALDARQELAHLTNQGCRTTYGCSTTPTNDGIVAETGAPAAVSVPAPLSMANTCTSPDP